MLKSYIIGFVLCILLTLAAYFSRSVPLLLTFAFVQAAVQMVLFLHLGQEPRPYWNTIFFILMVTIVVILIGGSLWIMYNLNYHTMPRYD